MKKRFIVGFLLLSLIMCILSGFSLTPERSDSPDMVRVELSTPIGPISGLQTEGISVYKGIPYAKQPERFAPPEAAEPWTEALDCTSFGPIPLQEDSPLNAQGLPTSEDCLSLNVWTPAKSAGEALPVYVWIHGGGYAVGSGAGVNYDGMALAREGIVHVTINYRLNALGWLATNETLKQYGTTGNWGLLDQVMALEWVQSNIAAFGGDPNRVTVGGESAGSYSVSGLITSPLAKGLFQNAIMESGSMLGVAGVNQYARGNLERSIEIGRQFAFTFGAEDNAEGLQKLREANPGVMVSMSPLDGDFTKIPSYLMFPVNDGYALPERPLEALQNGEVNPVNLLWGFNANEGYNFIPDTVDQDKYEMLAAKMFGYDKAQIIVERFPADDDNPAYQRSRDILMHGMFATAMKPYADAVYNAGMNVYGYYFTYATQEAKKAGVGAAHGTELPYVFGNLQPGATSEQKAVSEEMFARWVSFIKYGDPNAGAAPSGVVWDKYDPRNFHVMTFDKEPVCTEHPILEDVEFMEDIMFGPESTYLD